MNLKLLSGIVSLSTSFGIGALAMFAPAPAQAQVSRCDQIEDRERRQRCRSAIYQAEAYKEEERSYREAERDIRDQHKRGCAGPDRSKSAAVGSAWCATCPG